MGEKTVLVTGATGYIGGRLVPHLLRMGYRVHVFVRDPERLKGRKWVESVRVFQGDVLAPKTLRRSYGGGRGGILPDPQYGWER